MDLVRRIVEYQHTTGFKLWAKWQGLIHPIQRARAMRARDRFCKTYIGITGSCGKTTTTELLGMMLARYGKTATGAGRNTPHGIFRTLRHMRGPVAHVVQEISGHAGKEVLRKIAETLRIDVAIITAVGLEHRKKYGDEAAIAEAKSQLAIAVHEDGVACLNADDPRVRAMALVAGGRVVLYGLSADAQVRAENVVARWPQRLSFTLVIGERRYSVTTRLAGTLMLTNVLAAFATVDALGYDLAPAIAAAAEFEPVFEHMSVHRGAQHDFVLDSDKAPLWSTLMLLDDLPRLRGPSTVVVLGQISETTGDPGRKYRSAVLQAAANADHVIVLGRAAEQAVKLIKAGRVDNVTPARNVLEAAGMLKALPPSLVLVKSAGIAKLTRLWLAMEQPVACQRLRCEIVVPCTKCALLTRAIRDKPKEPAESELGAEAA